MGTDNLKELQKNFLEKVSDEVAKFFSTNQAVYGFKNSEGDICYIIEKISLGALTMKVMATFIKVSNEDYKCKLRLYDFPDVFGLQNPDFENKYEGKLIVGAFLVEPKVINVIIKKY